MARPKHRVMTFAEFMATPRSDEEAEAFQAQWAALREMGAIDEHGREIVQADRPQAVEVRT